MSHGINRQPVWEGVLASFSAAGAARRSSSVVVVAGLSVTFGLIAGAGGSCGFCSRGPPFPRSTLTPARGLANGSHLLRQVDSAARRTVLTLYALIRHVGMAWAFRVLGLVTVGDWCICWVVHD
ncbi:hypothetical protein MY4824_007006 [Beauveria thailandica]